MKLYEIFQLKMSYDDAYKEDVPSCVVPNAAMSPSEVMRLYSRGEISPLANSPVENEIVERHAHTDPLYALSLAQDFNADLLAFQPTLPTPLKDPAQKEPALPPPEKQPAGPSAA